MRPDGESLPWHIPPSWAWNTIGEVANVVGGSTPRTSEALYYDGGTIPWITPADLSNYKEKLISHGARDITLAGLNESGARLMPAGTVLFSSRAPIGYVAIASVPVSTNQGFKSFVLGGGLLPDYVYYYLKRAKELAVFLASGTTFKEISGKNAAKIPISIAPLPEQSRIVEAIETNLTKLDAVVAALERVQANLKRYRASVLKAAVGGRLVPTEAELARQEGRDYEPASVLLERILVERRRRWEEAELAAMKAKGKTPKDDKWKAKYREPVALDTNGLPELSEGWCWASLEALAEVIDPNPSHRMPRYTDKGFPLISTENFTSHGGIDFAIGKQVSGETLQEQKDRFELRDGSFALSRIGTIGRTRRLPLERNYCLSHAVCVITPYSSDFSADYLRWCVSSPTVLDQALAGVQSIGVPDLGMATIRKFRQFAVPLARSFESPP